MKLSLEDKDNSPAYLYDHLITLEKIKIFRSVFVDYEIINEYYEAVRKYYSVSCEYYEAM